MILHHHTNHHSGTTNTKCPNHINVVGLFGIGLPIMSVVLSGIILSSLRTSATDTTSYEDQVSITVPASCTMGGVGSNTHNATLTPGTWSGASGSDYENGIGKTTLTVFCNDYNGFSIYAVGYTGNTAGNTNLVGANTSTNIATGTSTSGATSNWSMKVNKETDTSIAYNPANMNVPVAYTSWHEVPSTYTQVAEYKASTGSSATDDVKGAKVNTTYAAFISSTQVADTYEGQVKYTMVHPYNNDTNSYIVEFLANGGTGTMTPQKISRGTATALTTNAFTAPTGLSFKEWNTKADGTGTSYADGASVTNIGEAGSSIALFAIWEPIYYMQNVSEWKDTVLPNIGDETVAVDARDNKKYYVAKLPDGNIWMTQNLDHNISSSYSYNSTNTDVPSSPGTLTSTYATGTTTWNWSTTAPESYDPGDRCWNGTLDPNWSTNLDTGTTACSSITTTPDHYHIGNYYNWTAAVAMQNSSSYTADNTDVNQSICPAGWMLPKKTGSGSFYGLINGRYTAGTSGNIQSAPVYFVYGGVWGGSSDLVSSYGYYWSSVVRSSGASYYLGFDVDGYLDPQNYDDRNLGYLVRCLAR